MSMNDIFIDKRDNYLGVRLNSNERDQLKYISGKNTESASETIRRLIDEEYEKMNRNEDSKGKKR